MKSMEIMVEHKPEKESSSKEKELEHILEENLRMIPDKVDDKKSEDIGCGLYISSEDNHSLHIQEHSSFMAANTLRPQYKSQLQQHIKKHELAQKEMNRMGIGKKEKKEVKDIEDTKENY